MTTPQKDPAVLKRLRRARRLRDEREQLFAEAVREALAERGGFTVREIAEAAGISRERVYQIKARRR